MISNPGKKLKIISSFIILFAIAVVPLAGSAYAQGDEYETISPELVEQLREIYQQKAALTPAQRKIDWNILQVARQAKERLLAAQHGESPNFRDLSTPILKIDNEGRIEVKLTVVAVTDEQVEQLEALGMYVRLTLPKYGVIEGTLSYEQVETVAGLDFVVNVAMPGYALYDTGDVTSEGDAVLRAAEARAAFGVDGSGVKVGVMSNGVSHLSASQASGDLPAVQVLKAGSGDEGTAMLEIVHDLAPGSPLAFYGPDPSSSDMVIGIDVLEAAGCDIIVDDITYRDEPKFEDGPIAQEARQFCADGGVYVTSAGNSAQRHYIHQYVRTTGPGSYAGAHDYGGGDVGNAFTVPNGETIVTILQWNNQWGLSGDDFDLVLHRSSDMEILAVCDNYQTGTGDPYETFSWTNDTGSSVSAFIAVWEWSLVSPPSSLMLDYHVWYLPSVLQYSMSENSVIGHSAVSEVLSVAAADAATPSTIESYSSRGPGTIYFPTYEERQVPNIAGVDKVHTKTGQLGHFVDPFPGTSAAAPHVAAVAALVWQANPTLTSSQVFDAITGTAVDLGSVGYDYTWGFGRVDAYEAVASVISSSAPTVTTNAATLVEESTATLNGTISDDGGEACQYRFEYDTNSGEPYAYNTGWTGSKTTGQSFSAAISNLNKGTKYYFRAQAKNSAGTASGSELTFLTKPDAPSSFGATTASTTQINLSWTKGDGAQKTKIQRKQGSYPANRNDGTQVYFGTGTSTPDTGLTPGTTYYYRAWSYVQGSEQWSDNYAQASAATAGAQPDVPDITVSPTSFEETGPPGTSWTRTLTIGNVGNAELNYTLSDTETTGGASTGKAENLLIKPANMALGLPLEGSPIEPESTPQDGTGWQNIMTDGFEGAFPDTKWQLFGSPRWGKESYRRHTGSYSAWCAGSSYNPPSNYPNNMEAWMVYGPFSLADATDAELGYYLWLGAEEGYDAVYEMASTDGVWFHGLGWTGSSGDWLNMSFDLTDVYTLGNLCGQPQVWIAFVFESNYIITDKGAFIDDVVLRKYVGGAAEDCPWLDEEPKSGTVPPGGEADITVTFDTTGLGSTYTANIIISSNDPDEPQIIVPVTLVIPGVSPSVSIEPPNQTVAPGWTFNVDVWIDAVGRDLNGIDIAVQYNSDAMTTSVADIEAHNLLDGLEIGPEVEEAAGVGEVTYQLASGTAVAGIDASVMTIHFTMDAGAAPATYDLTVSTGTLIEPPDATEVEGVETNDGAVTVVIGRKGDFNGDGDINIFDFVMFAAAYDSELGDANYNPAGDFDDDGVINIFDFVNFAAVYGT